MKRWGPWLIIAVLASAAGLAAAAEPANGALDNLPDATSAVYVTSFDSDSVLRFDADTGAFLGVFVPPGSGGLNGPSGLAFGPDGHLYVASFAFNNSVLKYHGATGAFLGVFVESGSGGLQGPWDLGFGPDGDLYVAASYGGAVFRYDGQTGAFVSQFTNGPDGAEALGWREGDLYVSSHSSDNVIRFDGQTGAWKGSISGHGLAGPLDIVFRRPRSTDRLQ